MGSPPNLLSHHLGPDPEPYGDRFDRLCDRDVPAKARRVLEPLRVVVAGGGPAAVETLLALRALAEERVELELVAPSPDFVYRPLAVLQPFGDEEPHRFTLAGIARDCGATFRQNRLLGVDIERRRALLADGSEVPYGALVLAMGAIPHPALPGALTFPGQAFTRLLKEIEAGRKRRIVFAVPGGVVWSLPLYELALLTAARCRERGTVGVELTLVTPEDSPLAVFGLRAAASVERSLRQAGVRLETGVYPSVVEDGSLVVVPGGRIPADAVVALPRLEGPRITGIRHDPAGFIPTDRHGRVPGAGAVYAAGDATTFPVKQGGLATQQADAVAATVAATAGAPVEADEFEPILRGLFVTGGQPTYLRTELRGGRGDTSLAHADPLWWPASKIAGRHLGNYLATLLADAPQPAHS